MADFHTINPATEERLAGYSFLSASQLTLQINKTQEAWRQWKEVSCLKRAQSLQKLAELLGMYKEDLGLLITLEMGKPLSQSISEIEKCQWVCEYYADHGVQYLENEVIKTEASNSYITYQPLGIILAIMPWNFPFWQAFRFAAPNLMAGNAMVLKHAPNTTGCALKIQQLFELAGFSKHVFNTVIAEIPDMEAIISHPDVKALTLTGSTQAGKSVAALAGKHLKKTVLELGGSDPYVILDDADLDLAVEKCVASRLINTGQSCIAAKRFIVTDQNAQKFTEQVHALMVQKHYGDPLTDQYALGTLARKDLRDQLHNQVTQSITKGSQCLLGGRIPDENGFYYPATLLTDVKPGMPAYDEELFGPVASIITAKDEHQALKIANSTSFGLGAAVFSADIERAQHLAAKHIEAGCVFVNDFVKSDPRLPFGGINQSGYGRELSALGIKEFVNAKTIYVA